MRIAVPLVADKLCQHFGHCETFAFIEVDPDAGTIGQREDRIPPPHEPGLLPAWIAAQAATVVIAGGMGQRARSLLNQQGIEVIVGAPPHAPEQLARDFLAGVLATGENACDH